MGLSAGRIFGCVHNMSTEHCAGQAAQAGAMIRDCCPDCGVSLGRNHREGCDVERCPHCGGQALGCVGFDPHDPRRQVWDGKWPGEGDCERLGFYVNGDRSLPDINRLFVECVWNRDLQRWEQAARPDADMLH
jgi:hypothetical protein